MNLGVEFGEMPLIEADTFRRRPQESRGRAGEMLGAGDIDVAKMLAHEIAKSRAAIVALVDSKLTTAVHATA